MARIRKEDQATILMRIDVERCPVREIAAEYGCTPAAIYALLKKLRREAAGPTAEPAEIQPPLALAPAAPPQAAPPPGPSFEPPPPREEPRLVVLERPAPHPAPASPSSAREAPARPEPMTRLGAKLARPGMGLAMRTSDGEETMTPFRSVDDLLSAIKPILRASARSPEPVWFSLQPIDLSAIDVDAA